MGFSAKCSFVNSLFNQVEKLKMNLLYSRLILLDHTTYVQEDLKIQILIKR